jgi:cellulose synthase/poly-beta-1,6-N-acetylglucosamine synthase-like glycosyltransferase
MAGYRIDYEHQAKGDGEAPLGWEQARKTRLRWLKGTRESNRGNIRQMLAAAIRERSMAIMDCVLQAVIPSFSTIAAFAMGFLILQVLVNLILPDPIFPPNVLIAWICLGSLRFSIRWGGCFLKKPP